MLEAFESGKDFQKIFIQSHMRNERSAEVLATAKERDIPIQFVPVQKLNKLTRKAHQGIVAFLSPIEFADLENLIHSVYVDGETPRFVALDGVTDVRNFGAICRSAECFGFHGVIVPTTGMAPINEDAIKTSAGALMRLPVCRVASMKQALKTLTDSGIQLIGLTEKSEVSLKDHSSDDPFCMVMGSEDTGLSDEALRSCEYLYRIPMAGKTQSLNVSVSAGIAMFALSK